MYSLQLRAIEVDPDDDSFIYTRGSGAHYKSSDGGSTWHERNVGLLLPRANAIAKSGAHVLNVGSGHVFLSEDVGATWEVVFDETWMGANQKAVAFDPNNDQYALAGFGIPDLAKMFRTTDGGESWNLVLLYGTANGTTAVSDIAYQGSGSENVYASLYVPFETYVAKSTNRGLSWGASLSLTNTSIRLLSVAVSGSSVYSGGGVVGGSAGVVYKSTDGGASWSQVSNGLPTASNSFVNSLAIDPFSSNTVYAATTSGMYKTTDGGSNWSAINSGITYTNMTSVLIHPINRSIVYAASNDGSTHARVYRTTTAGASWSELSTGLPLSSISGLAIDATNPNAIFAATDSGVYHIAHRWTGEIAASTTWQSNQTYIVEGTLTVPEGKTLEISPGATVKALADAQIEVSGTLSASGTPGSPIAFTTNSPSHEWQGISFLSPSQSTLEYAVLSNAQTAIKTPHVGPVISYCEISGGDIGIHVYEMTPQDEVSPAQITNCTISGPSVAGILVDENASLCIIQDNTITGGSGTFAGLYFVSSSPTQVVRNRVSGFDNMGILCIAASPAFVDGTNGGNNCSVNNSYGLWADESASPIFGIDEGVAPGYNSLTANTNFQVLLKADCYVPAQLCFFREGGPVPREDFDIDPSSVLEWEPSLSEDPNDCAGDQQFLAKRTRSAGTVVEGGGDDPPQGFWDNPLVRQAIRLRVQRQHAAAIGVLRSLISNRAEEPLFVWAVHQLVANYQHVRRPAGANRLSPYLRNMLQAESNPRLKRAIRQTLASALLKESNVAATLSMLDETIENHPNTTSEVLALYRKAGIALNRLRDNEMAEGVVQTMRNRYPEHNLTLLAEAVVGATSQSSLNRGVANTSTRKSNRVQSVPASYALSQNYPNPFNPNTTIRYDLPEDSHVSLVVYDVLGRKVAEVINEVQGAGFKSVTWDASAVASGVYFARFTAMGANGSVKLSKTMKLVLAK